MSVTILCRLCAQESDNYIRIFDDEGKNLDLLKKITQCLQILLFPDDALPKEVCKQCCFRLDETFKFHECCSQAQEILISLFNGKQPLSKSDLNTQIEMTVPPQENFNSDLNAAPDVRQLKSCNSELLSVENKALCQQVETYECRNDGNKISKSLTNLDKVPSDNNGNGEPRLRVLFQGSKNGDMNLCNTIVKHDRPQLSNANDNCQNGNDDTLDRDSDDYSGPEEVGGNGERVGVKSRRGERKGWFCYECSSILRTLPALRDHYMKEHNKQPVFKCVYCSKVYNRYRSYARHVKTHDDEKKHSCEVCGKRFAHKTILKSHRAVHSEERPYSCAQCGKTFKQFSSLFIHNKNHTTSQTKFPCTQCSKLFATKHSLMGHVKSHAGVRDFVCDICGKSFIAKSSFDYHLRTHEENKPHICNVCGKSFRTSKLLSKHATLHSGVKPHQCDVCGKQFRERSALREHNRIHTGAMPYACQYCGKLFRFKGILTVHLRQHTGERPYRCTECHRTFTNWANLNKHTKRRHKNTVQASDSLQQPTESTNNCQQSSMVDNEPNLTRNMVDNEPNLTHNMATVPHSTVVACETPSATLNACVNPSTVHNTCENSSTLHSACANPAAFSETYKMSDNSALVSSDAVYRTQHAVFIPLTDVGYYSSHDLQFLNSNR